MRPFVVLAGNVYEILLAVWIGVIWLLSLAMVWFFGKASAFNEMRRWWRKESS